LKCVISCHVCHPSLANDNLSGVTVATALGKAVSGTGSPLFVSVPVHPGTIGAITWLAQNRDKTNRIQHGLVLTGIGNREWLPLQEKAGEVLTSTTP